MDVLNLVPPAITYRHRSDKVPSATPTISEWRRTPVKVVNWNDFLDNVNTYSPSNNPVYNEKNFEFQETQDISLEKDVEKALTQNVFRLLGQLAGPGEKFGSHNAIAIVGDPDFIFYDTSPSLLLAIEVKTKYVLSSKNLVRKYKRDIKRYKADRTSKKSTLYQVHQIFGYLSWNRLQYGVLTTYEKTWFLKRNRGKLYVSPAIRYKRRDPTLFQCYAYIMELARQDCFNPPAPPTPPLSPPPPDSSPYDNSDDSDYDPKGGDSQKKRKRNDGDSSQSKRKKGDKDS